jgi:ketosteroid isomerase-like protein
MTGREHYDRLNAAYVAAHEAGDAQAIGRLFTEDAMLLSPGLPPILGRTAIEESYEAYIKNGVAITMDIMEFHASGNLAYGLGTFGGEFGVGNFMDVLKRQRDGSYLIHRTCWNSR